MFNLKKKTIEMKNLKILLILFVIFTLVSCRERKPSKPGDPNVENTTSQKEQKIEWEEEDVPQNNEKTNETQSGPAQNAIRARNNKGIGPVTEVVLLNHIDEKMVSKGERLFNNECASCHRIHESGKGPALGNVLERRSPEFVMNIILNTQEMIEKDPVVMSLKGQYESEMVQVDVTQEEAREIVEYLRTYQ